MAPQSSDLKPDMPKIAGMKADHAVSYHFDAFPPDQLDITALYKLIAHTTDAIARFDQMLKGMHNSEILLAPLRNQEAVISSRMEGTISTIDEILQYEAEYDDHKHGAVREARHEVVETWLYQRALKTGQKALSEGYSFTEFLVRQMHQELLSFGRGAEKTPGLYKTEQNFLVDKIAKEIMFIPISPEKLEDGMQKLFLYMNNAEEQILLKTAISHVEFEALHPFQDGNGRIGRMLITLLLWQHKVISQPHFYISGYLEEHKDEYIERMRRVSSHGEWTQWCAFFLEMLEQQAIRNLTITEKIQHLYEDMKIQFSSILSSKWSIQAVDYIFANPIFLNTKFVRDSGIHKASARKLPPLLEKANMLKKLRPGTGQQAAIYGFEPLLELVRV